MTPPIRAKRCVECPFNSGDRGLGVCMDLVAIFGERVNEGPRVFACHTAALLR